MNPPLAEAEDPGDEIEDGGLAGAVGTDEPHQLALGQPPEEKSEMAWRPPKLWDKSMISNKGDMDLLHELPASHGPRGIHASFNCMVRKTHRFTGTAGAYILRQ